MIEENGRCLKRRYASVLFIILVSAVICISSSAYAGGVYLGFGVDVPPPGHAVAPPEMYPPPVAVERASAPRAVVVGRTPPVVVYDEPVVVERRSSLYYYYRPSYPYRSYRVETGRAYYRHRSHDREDERQY